MPRVLGLLLAVRSPFDLQHGKQSLCCADYFTINLALPWKPHCARVRHVLQGFTVDGQQQSAHARESFVNKCIQVIGPGENETEAIQGFVMENMLVQNCGWAVYVCSSRWVVNLKRPTEAFRVVRISWWPPDDVQHEVQQRGSSINHVWLGLCLIEKKIACFRIRQHSLQRRLQKLIIPRKEGNRWDKNKTLRKGRTWRIAADNIIYPGVLELMGMGKNGKSKEMGAWRSILA